MRFSLHSGRHAVPPVSRPGAPRSGGREQPSAPVPPQHVPAQQVPVQHVPVDHPSGPLPVPSPPEAQDRLDDDAPATVEVVGSRSTARLLEAVAPDVWRVVATERPSYHPGVDFVVLLEPDPALVADLVERRPGTEVVVLLPRTAPTEQLVAMLDAGVSICLRESPARLVAGHMLARRRRGGPRRRTRVER
ncbi:hypothetical protein [Actinomycetospora sp. TBRC 11914]|uniref:hypothetical protein n=1 Tax=Actinomycetospora sp. TBRC 11914 TaxID=2729387 RepID=UPI00145EDFF7|nr:hypothetical protein [Actinomycetospora sp. TBRC 11914]NMO89261.1 hypothetical protein [Actinomycetospora sp. TBRC 11914]